MPEGSKWFWQSRMACAELMPIGLLMAAVLVRQWQDYLWLLWCRVHTEDAFQHISFGHLEKIGDPHAWSCPGFARGP